MHWLDQYYGGIGRVMQPGYIVKLTDLLRGAGIPERILPYALAQISHETDGGYSALANDWHNWSGIKYTPNSPYQVGPINMMGMGKFAKYASDQKWAQDYKRILSMGKQPPIDAANADQFYHRLATNGYFTKSEAELYRVAFNRRIREISAVLKGEGKGQNWTVDQAIVQAHPDTTKLDPNTGKAKKKSKLQQAIDKEGFASNHPILFWGGVALAGAVLYRTAFGRH
jgi:hypothetical protein